VISSTGIDAKKRDVPWLFLPMYRYLLEVPYADKKIMEKMVTERERNFILKRYS
jgi:hypothetical protein